MPGGKQEISGLEDGGGWLMGDFVERHPYLAMPLDREAAVTCLLPHYREAVLRLGADFDDLRTAEQIHGNAVAVADEGEIHEGGGMPRLHAGVDGLVTSRPGVLLGILVADCCAVSIVDTRRRAIGLVHSGKKGTELDIVSKTIEMMGERFGSQAADMRVVLSPCIRPPLFEVDIAAMIRAQCLAVGVPATQVHDGGLCTGSDLTRFYSYRIEKGKTGRMLALLGLRDGNGSGKAV